MQIPAAQSTTVIPVTTNALPSAHIPVLKAEQRIALFRREHEVCQQDSGSGACVGGDSDSFH